MEKVDEISEKLKAKLGEVSEFLDRLAVLRSSEESVKSQLKSAESRILDLQSHLAAKDSIIFD